MKIYLIRHGQTTGDIEDRYGGDYDDHLTEGGRNQARDLASKLEGLGIEVIFHSPRFRAIETAEICANHLDLNTRVVEDLRERNNYGVLTGMIKSEAKERFPDEVEKLNTYKYHDVMDSEDYEHFRERVVRAFENLLTLDYRTIAVISHGGPIGCVVDEVLKVGSITSLNDCAILEIVNAAKGLKLVSMDGAELE